MMEDIIYRIRNLNVSSLEGNLEEVSIDIVKGDNIMIYSKNDTSRFFLDCLTLDHKASSGEILYFGDDIIPYSIIDKDEYKTNDIGYVSSKIALLNNLSVLDNIYLPLSINRMEEDKKYISELFELFNIDKYLPKKTDSLYPYEIIIIKTIRALVRRPFSLFISNVSSVLDEKEIGDYLSLVNKINDIYKITVVSSTDNPDLLKYANRKIIIENNQFTEI